MMLDDVGFSLNLLKIFVEHRATLLAQQRCTMLVSLELAVTKLTMTSCHFKASKIISSNYFMDVLYAGMISNMSTSGKRKFCFTTVETIELLPVCMDILKEHLDNFLKKYYYSYS